MNLTSTAVSATLTTVSSARAGHGLLALRLGALPVAGTKAHAAAQAIACGLRLAAVRVPCLASTRD